MALEANVTIKRLDPRIAEYMKAVSVRIPIAFSSWMDEAGEIGVQAMREEAPVKSGELRDSIESYRSGHFSVKIGPTAPHGLYVEKGTRAHIIEGRPVLSWVSPDGTRVWASHVHHPGTKANPFVERTRSRIVEILIDLVKEKLQGALKQ